MIVVLLKKSFGTDYVTLEFKQELDNEGPPPRSLILSLLYYSSLPS